VRLKAIEDRLDRLAIRADAVEGLLFTVAEVALASLGEAEARGVVGYLRENIRVGEATISGNWDPCENGAALETEVYASRLLDQIEQSAKAIRAQGRAANATEYDFVNHRPWSSSVYPLP